MQQNITRLAVSIATILFVAVPAMAQQRPDFLFGRPGNSIAIRGQWHQPRAASDLYDFVTKELTLEKDDFNAPGLAVDFGFSLTPRVDFRTGIDFTSAFARTEYRDFTEGGLAIEQDTRMQQLDLVASIVFALTPRGRAIGQYSYIPNRVVPYIGAGGGIMRYQLEQEGDFVETNAQSAYYLDIFSERYVSNGWTTSTHVFTGLDVRLTPNVFLTGELRQIWGNAELKGGFVGFDPIDLTGLRIAAGIKFVF